MVINGTEYRLKWALNVNWVISTSRDFFTNGVPKTWDYGIGADTVKTVITAKGKYTDLQSLISLLQTNRDLTINAGPGEAVFGPQVNYTNDIDVIVEGEPKLFRDNFNFWTLKFVIIGEGLTLTGPTVPTKDYWYPAKYKAGESDINSRTNLSSYGEVSTSFKNTVGRCTMRFNLDWERAQMQIRYIIETIRGNGFTLPPAMETLKPFGEKIYTHAIILGFSFVIRDLTNIDITLKLQSYNNG